MAVYEHPVLTTCIGSWHRFCGKRYVNAFVFDLQYGCRDVTCKPAMASLLHGISPSTVTGKKPLPAF